jgi:GntR family transcriptional regulator
LSSYGLKVTNQLLRVVEFPCVGEVAANLGIDNGTPVLSVERLRYAKNTPVIYSVDFLEKKRLPETWTEQDLCGSLFEYLEQQAGILLDNSQATIRSTSLPVELDELMGSPKVCWILLEQVIFDRQGEPLIFSKDYHRGDYILFNVHRYRR